MFPSPQHAGQGAPGRQEPRLLGERAPIELGGLPLLPEDLADLSHAIGDRRLLRGRERPLAEVEAPLERGE